MADISQIQYKRFKESENKRISHDMKKLKNKNDDAYRKKVKSHEHTMTRMTEEYEQKIRNLDIELQRKLIALRNKQKAVIKEENLRLGEEVENLKKVHGDQVAEIKISHKNEINDLNESHRRALENAETRYIKEKTKWEV